ncbi:uncharacterized protein [Procambarus clarkii]|uniref:uncharacterized protein n=1 Tax=Procambarus clarkii TaxID=6728 RepID=UPI0037446113
MELWNKLFTHRRKNEITKIHKVPAPATHSSHHQSSAAPPPFHLQKDGVRVLLFRECDSRGRKLLYDSKTVVRVPVAENWSAPPSCKALLKNSWSSGPAGSIMLSNTQLSQHNSTTTSSSNVKSSTLSSKSDGFVEMSSGFGYQYRQQESDTKSLGELVFGTVALAYRGPSSKLHLLHNPLRVLLSRIAPAPNSHLRPSCAGSDQGIEDASFSSSISSWSGSTSRTESLEAPWGPGGFGGTQTWAVEMPHLLSTSHSEGDSGFGGPPSPYSSTCGSFLSPPSIPNTPVGTPSSRQGSGNSLKHSGSLNSLQRRFLHNVNTSLEALGRDSEMQEEGSSSSLQPGRRATKLGIAVIIQLGNGVSELERQLEEWIFLHLTVIESLMNKLQSSLDAAYLHRQSFVSSTHQAVTQLQQDIIDMVSGPRLCRPVWLGLLGKPSASDRQALCSTFVDTLASVLNTFDTKQTNFFVSKLLTAVLTHHLGWVSTVAPADQGASSAAGNTTVSSATSASFTALTHPSWVERLNESHPYNAVWAQLCELNGAVGYPPRAARTLLVGSNATLLAQLLTILSYVIRCSQVVEQDMECHQLGNHTSVEPPSCFSCTSSVSSIVTIVEGGKRETQKDCTRDTKQLQNRQLQRESSIRRSWRMNREGCSGRFLSSESRGDSTSELAMRSAGHVLTDEFQHGSECEPEPLPVSHQPPKKADQTSKWMLNDDEEIVIKGVKYNEDSSCNIINQNKVSLEKKDKELLEPERMILLPSHGFGKTLSTCKTSRNLASLGSDVGSKSSPNIINSTECNNVKAVKGNAERLYPTLYELDDHKETFGPVILEPEIIAEKVQKLFRVPAPCSGSQELNQERLISSSSPRSVVQNLDYVKVNEENYALQPVRCITTLPRTKKLQPLNYGFVCDGASYSDLPQLSPTVTDDQIKERSSDKYVGTDGDERLSFDEVTVPATDIHPEIEEGGSVLYLLDDDTLKEQCKSTTIEQNANSQLKFETGCQTHISREGKFTTAIGFEGLGVIGGEACCNSGTPEVTRVSCLPKPLDTRKVIRTINVGRDSGRDLTKLQRECAVYPSLSDFKQDLRIYKGCSTGKGGKLVTKTHRRHHSDPTNGDYAYTMPQPLIGVIEEQAIVQNKLVLDKNISQLNVASSVDSEIKRLRCQQEASPRTVVSSVGSENERLGCQQEASPRTVVSSVSSENERLCCQQETSPRTVVSSVSSENERLHYQQETSPRTVVSSVSSDNERLHYQQEASPRTVVSSENEKFCQQDTSPRTVVSSVSSENERLYYQQEASPRTVVSSVSSENERLLHQQEVSPRTVEGAPSIGNKSLPPDINNESSGTYNLCTKKDSTNEVSKEVGTACVSELPVNIQMPRCTCVGCSPSGASQSRSINCNKGISINSINSSKSPENSSIGCSLAGSLFGGVIDHYSSVFVVHATTQTHQWEDALRHDLSAAAHCSTLDQQVAEAVAVVADTNTWEVQVMSSHTYVVEHTGSGGQVGPRVGMSPLVSAITDSVLDLARMAVGPQFIMQHFEERLCELYLKSQLLAEYLLGGAGASLRGTEAALSPYHLPELTRALGFDLNDLPLLLAVASTHTPALTRMFGLSIK